MIRSALGHKDPDQQVILGNAAFDRGSITSAATIWSELDRLRAGPPRQGVVPVEPVLQANIKFFGRHKGGFIRDGVLLGLR